MNDAEQKILQRHLINFLISDVFNTITEDDILSIKGTNVWAWNGKQLTPQQVNALRNEAVAFKNSGLWKILKNELLWLAKQAGFAKAKTESDMVSGKLLEYLTDVIDTKLDRMAQ